MYLARTNHAYRRLHLLHSPDLYWRRMRAKQQAIPQRLRFLARDKKRVLRVARRMVRREVQRLKVVVVRFDLRSLFDQVAEIAKHADHLVHRLDDRMLGANRTANAGKRDIDSFRRKLLR